MTAVTSATEARTQLGRSAAVSVAAVMLGLGALAGLIARVAGFGAGYLAAVAGAFILAAGALLRALPHHLPQRRLGAANQVTLVRLALVSALAGLCTTPHSGLAWIAVVLAMASAALDGVDGWLARRQGTVSAFGARFDMETDSLLIAALSVLVWQLDKAGAWVLLSASMRYLFVAVSLQWPWLGCELPPSRRRTGVCVAQIVCLIASLAPVVPMPWSARVAALGLGLLCYSFAVDVAWLRRRRDTPL